MVRLVFLSFFITAVITAALGLRASQQRSTAAAEADAKPAPADIEILPNGVPIFSPDGTITQQLVDWLASADRSGERRIRYFELGGTQFLGASESPVPSAAARIPRLVAMLKAYPRAKAHVIGFAAAAGDPHANQLLSEARAKWLVDALVVGGIPRARLSFEGRSDAPSLGTSAAPSGAAGRERVGLVLALDDR